MRAWHVIAIYSINVNCAMEYVTEHMYGCYTYMHVRTYNLWGEFLGMAKEHHGFFAADPCWQPPYKSYFKLYRITSSFILALAFRAEHGRCAPHLQTFGAANLTPRLLARPLEMDVHDYKLAQTRIGHDPGVHSSRC
jgi:hypothetical protein